MSVAVLMPTRGRPEAFAKATKSVEDTSNAEVLAYIDDDWIDEYRAFGLPKCRVKVGPRIGPVASANALVSEFPGYDSYGLITDDSAITTKDWDGWVSGMHSKASLMVVCPHHNLGDVADMPFVTREWIDLVGWYACPEFYHWCWATISGLIGEMTAIAHAGESDFHVQHDSPGGVHSSNTAIRGTDNERFFEYASTELMKKVYLIRNHMFVGVEA